MACLIIFRPESVVGIKSRTGPESVSLVIELEFDVCEVAREFKRSVRL